MTGIIDFWARATSGQAAAALVSAMNSRRRMGPPPTTSGTQQTDILKVRWHVSNVPQNWKSTKSRYVPRSQVDFLFCQNLLHSGPR